MSARNIGTPLVAAVLDLRITQVTRQIAGTAMQLMNDYIHPPVTLL
jgi:hypothetical protein